MLDDVDAPDGIDFDGDEDMDRDSDDEEEDNEEEEDEEEEDEDEEEDKDEDDGKEPRTIDQGEMVNTSADDADTMVDDKPMMLHLQGQEMREHTPRPQPLAPAPWPHTPEPASRPQSLEPRPRPQTPDTHPLSGLEHLGLVTLQNPRPAVPTLREAEGARNTSDVHVDQQMLSEPAGGKDLPNVPLPNVPLPDASLPEARPDGSVGEK